MQVINSRKNYKLYNIEKLIMVEPNCALQYIFLLILEIFISILSIQKDYVTIKRQQ